MTGTTYVESVERIVRDELARNGARSPNAADAVDAAVWAFREWLRHLRAERAIDLAEDVIDSEMATAQGIAAITGEPDELAGFIKCLRRALGQLRRLRAELVEALGNFERVGEVVELPASGSEREDRWRRVAEVGIP